MVDESLSLGLSIVNQRSIDAIAAAGCPIDIRQNHSEIFEALKRHSGKIIVLSEELVEFLQRNIREDIAGLSVALEDATRIIPIIDDVRDRQRGFTVLRPQGS